MSSSCLSDGLALMLHTDCTVNESVYHTSVADLFQLMELFGHKLLFWPYWAAVLLLVSERLHHTTSFFLLTMNLFFLTQHPPPNLFHAFLKSDFFFFLLEKKSFFFSFFLNFFLFKCLPLLYFSPQHQGPTQTRRKAQISTVMMVAVMKVFFSLFSPFLTNKIKA